MKATAEVNNVKIHLEGKMTDMQPIIDALAHIKPGKGLTLHETWEVADAKQLYWHIAGIFEIDVRHPKTKEVKTLELRYDDIEDTWMDVSFEGFKMYHGVTHSLNVWVAEDNKGEPALNVTAYEVEYNPQEPEKYITTGDCSEYERLKIVSVKDDGRFFKDKLKKGRAYFNEKHVREWRRI